ncbi:MAG: hypothetical protein KDA27_20480 [Candidatus Eisenbacteria bacterium]|uniref:Uncharacterized protein n=1 Tax=Eiseniibacteriota bacterium TaxID=2212470 RepID=A0A956SH88_UNCEI|nr:hypothetical protein [Candidatus Eisenbacteria bacterium]MCB9463998.1 hypothetical protein [Candidatus Eisenbacteria bacterium]
MSIALNSVGTNLNRVLDSLGYQDKFGDALGSIADLGTGNIAGAFRNLVDLKSGLTTGQMDSILSGAGRPRFARAYAPRCGCGNAHLDGFRNTYAVREQVGKRAHIGQQYGFNWGPFQAQGRITGAQYRGSFAKPIRLADGDYLFRGRKYDNLGDIFRDARDGRIDGQATKLRPGLWRPGMGQSPRPLFPSAFAFHPAMGAIGAGMGLGNTMGNALGNSLNDILGRLFGNGNGGGSAGGTGSTNGSGATGGAGDTGSILNDPSLSLEDKLALLMAKLTEHMDKQIEDKMKAIEQQMSNEKNGGANGANGSKGGGGLLGGLGSLAGGVAGSMFGPIGGMVGSQLGGSLGNSLGSAAGGGSSAGGANGSSENSSNLQLLQTQLQQLMQKRQQMFQTMSNILKSLHDTSMNTIRQLKA